MLTLLSELKEVNILIIFGFHLTPVTSFLWCLKICNLLFKFLKSHKAQVYSFDEVKNKYSLKGLKSTELTSWQWASIFLLDLINWFIFVLHKSIIILFIFSCNKMD